MMGLFLFPTPSKEFLRVKTWFKVEVGTGFRSELRGLLGMVRVMANVLCIWKALHR